MKDGNMPPLHLCVSKSLEQYFTNLEDEEANDVYQMVLDEIEPALLQAVMSYCNNNQSKAAQVLGINRSTLRRKLHLYDKSIFQKMQDND